MGRPAGTHKAARPFLRRRAGACCR